MQLLTSTSISLKFINYTGNHGNIAQNKYFSFIKKNSALSNTKKITFSSFAQICNLGCFKLEVFWVCD